MGLRALGQLIRFAYILQVLPMVWGAGQDRARAQDTMSGAQAAKRYFVIRVVDKQTRRGVPLIELRTVNNIRYVTDSQGIIAFYEPGLMDREVFFYVDGHGYTFPKDGFDMQGRALKTRPGQIEVLEVERVNLAERLYRVTGQGIYRDSILAGLPAPVKQPLLNGQVMGQDSVFTCQYQGRVFWFWGDTNRPAYPLGHFAMSGAVSDLPGRGGLDPESGVDLNYFVNDKGFSRPVAPLKEGGLVWLDGIMVVRDRNAGERMVARFARHQSLTEVLERGFMAYDDQTQQFDAIVRAGLDLLPFKNTAHAFPVRIGDKQYYYFTTPSPVGVRLRVRAIYEHAVDANAYEVLTAQGVLNANQPDAVNDHLGPGPGRYRWRRFGDLTNETGLPKASLVQALEEEVTDANVYDIETGKLVLAHNGTVHYNDFRKRWIAIFCQQFGTTSALGETWFAEADTPTGPWAYARKIITHDKYSFYNPKHHVLFDKDQGRRIFVEGTYTHTFSGTPETATPRYDYNQIMYGLNLDDSRLALPVPVYLLRNGAYVLGGDVNSANLWDQVESIPFYAMAPERAADDLPPVYATKHNLKGIPLTRLTMASPDAAGPALFCGLQVGHPTGDSVISVPLYEYRDPDSGQYAYWTDPQAPKTNWQRSKDPICRVWKTPPRLAETSDHP